MFFKNIVQNITSLSKKCDVSTRIFRFQKAHTETEIDEDEHDKFSLDNKTKETSHLKEAKY